MRRLPGLDEETFTEKIGATRYGNKTPLTDAEEKILLPRIIGVGPSASTWYEEVKNYYSNISVTVPSGKGLELQIGLNYLDEEAKGLSDVEAIETGRAIPISVPDFVLWRHCLVYSQCANDISLVGKSERIRLYIFDPEANIKETAKVARFIQQAVVKVTGLFGDRLSLRQFAMVLYEEHKEELKQWKLGADNEIPLNDPIIMSDAE